MEMNVNTGKGYVPAELNEPEEPPLGLIAIDSLYSPVKKVSYSLVQQEVKLLITIN